MKHSLDTKLKGDIAEYKVVIEALFHGINVSMPVGDRLPYDMIFDVRGKLLKIQVKAAWLDSRSGDYVVDTRISKTNRAKHKYVKYKNSDFDFAIVVIIAKNIFYVFPSSVFNSYRSGIKLGLTKNKQRKPKALKYKDAWFLIVNDAG